MHFNFQGFLFSMAQTTYYITINMHHSLLFVDAETEKISHDFLECSC